MSYVSQRYTVAKVKQKSKSKVVQGLVEPSLSGSNAKVPDFPRASPGRARALPAIHHSVRGLMTHLARSAVSARCGVGINSSHDLLIAFGVFFAKKSQGKCSATLNMRHMRIPSPVSWMLMRFGSVD